MKILILKYRLVGQLGTKLFEKRGKYECLRLFHQALVTSD